eukprot:4645260-Pleurochrysis_carterae.AAC.1
MRRRDTCFNPSSTHCSSEIEVMTHSLSATSSPPGCEAPAGKRRGKHKIIKRRTQEQKKTKIIKG